MVGLPKVDGLPNAGAPPKLGALPKAGDAPKAGLPPKAGAGFGNAAGDPKPDEAPPLNGPADCCCVLPPPPNALAPLPLNGPPPDAAWVLPKVPAPGRIY